MPRAKNRRPGRSTVNTSLSLAPDFLEQAKARARELGFENSFSAYVAKLIRDDLRVSSRAKDDCPGGRPHTPTVAEAFRAARRPGDASQTQ